LAAAKAAKQAAVEAVRKAEEELAALESPVASAAAAGARENEVAPDDKAGQTGRAPAKGRSSYYPREQAAAADLPEAESGEPRPAVLRSRQAVKAEAEQHRPQQQAWHLSSGKAKQQEEPGPPASDDDGRWDSTKWHEGTSWAGHGSSNSSWQNPGTRAWTSQVAPSRHELSATTLKIQNFTTQLVRYPTNSQGSSPRVLKCLDPNEEKFWVPSSLIGELLELDIASIETAVSLRTAGRKAAGFFYEGALDVEGELWISVSRREKGFSPAAFAVHCWELVGTTNKKLPKPAELAWRQEAGKLLHMLLKWHATDAAFQATFYLGGKDVTFEIEAVEQERHQKPKGFPPAPPPSLGNDRASQPRKKAGAPPSERHRRGHEDKHRAPHSEPAGRSTKRRAAAAHGHTDDEDDECDYDEADEVAEAAEEGASEEEGRDSSTSMYWVDERNQVGEDVPWRQGQPRVAGGHAKAAVPPSALRRRRHKEHGERGSTKTGRRKASRISARAAKGPAASPEPERGRGRRRTRPDEAAATRRSSRPAAAAEKPPKKRQAPPEKAVPAGKKAKVEQLGGKASTSGSSRDKKPLAAAPEPSGRERRAPVAAERRQPKTPIKLEVVEPRKAGKTGKQAESKQVKTAAAGGGTAQSSGKPQPDGGKKTQTAKGTQAHAKVAAKDCDEDEYYSSSYSDGEAGSYSPASGTVDSNDI
jgi:hypothetical protein